MQAVLWVSSTAPCTDFTARLVDVHPDGRAISVCDGIRRVRFPDSSDGVSGEPVEITIELGPVGQVFLADHALRLDISSSNFPRFDLNPNTGGRSFDETVMRVAWQRVFHEREYPSRLVLPTIPLDQSRELRVAGTSRR